MNGETVGIDDTFSNGLWPGDATGDAVRRRQLQLLARQINL
jgi:hypothetical protein